MTYNMIITLSFLLTLMKHPLSMGLILIIQTIFISIMMGLISQSFWFSYILFLIMVGGMLILFIYVISMIYNKKFIQNFKYFSMKLIMFLLFMFMINKNLTMNNFEIMNLKIYFMNYELNINIMKLYNFPINFINLLLMNYLFLLLIIAVKITNFYYGPMRLKI